MRARNPISEPPETSEPTAMADLPGFPPLPPGQDNPDPAPPVTATGSSGGPGEGSGSGSRSGIRDPTPIKDLRSSPYEAIARGLLRALGGLLNSRVQVDDDDTSFIPDNDDDKTIPPPVGRIAARHMPVSGKADISELEDIGAAAVGLLAWAAKGIVSAWEARRDKRRLRKAAAQAGTAFYDDTGAGEQL